MNRRDYQIPLLTVFEIIALVFLSIAQNEIAETIDINRHILGGFTIILIILIILIKLIAFRQSNKSKLMQNLPNDALVGKECGLEPLRLENERHFFSATLGSYFASLLESEEAYTLVHGQIEYPVGTLSSESTPFQAIASSLVDRNGVQILIIAAEGGMGKSTLAARLVRCLYSSREVERILGDSAKTEIIDLRTGKKIEQQPGYTDKKTLYQRLAIQVGLTEQLASKGVSIEFLRNALFSYKTLIILDNLETVEDASSVVESLRPLVGKSLRLIITTREIPTNINYSKMLIIRLNPLNKTDDMRDFINWHIQHYQAIIPDLGNLKDQLSRRNIALLIEKSGGVPLIVQLLLSDVASKSWKILDEVPALVPTQVLEYLYQKRWIDLQDTDETIKLAKQILIFVVNRQKHRQKVDMSILSSKFKSAMNLLDAIGYLQDKFLLINRNTKSGEFVVYPSLLAYVESQVEKTSA